MHINGLDGVHTVSANNVDLSVLSHAETQPCQTKALTRFGWLVFFSSHLSVVATLRAKWWYFSFYFFLLCVSTSLTYRSYPANKNPLNVEMKYESSANDVIRFHLVRRRRPRGIHFRGKPFMESFSVACQRKANFERIYCKSMNSDGFFHMVHSHIPIRKIWCSWEQTNWLKYSWAKLSSSASQQNHASLSITYYYIISSHSLRQRFDGTVEGQPKALCFFENGSFAAAQEPNKWAKKNERQLHGWWLLNMPSGNWIQYFTSSGQKLRWRKMQCAFYLSWL